MQNKNAFLQEINKHAPTPSQPAPHSLRDRPGPVRRDPGQLLLLPQVWSTAKYPDPPSVGQRVSQGVCKQVPMHWPLSHWSVCPTVHPLWPPAASAHHAACRRLHWRHPAAPTWCGPAGSGNGGQGRAVAMSWQSGGHGRAVVKAERWSRQSGGHVMAERWSWRSSDHGGALLKVLPNVHGGLAAIEMLRSGGHGMVAMRVSGQWRWRW